jgi:hypothetical protein
MRWKRPGRRCTDSWRPRCNRVPSARPLEPARSRGTLTTVPSGADPSG